eukprot:6327894-Amphidinium_carterae.1
MISLQAGVQRQMLEEIRLAFTLPEQLGSISCGSTHALPSKQHSLDVFLGSCGVSHSVSVKTIIIVVVVVVVVVAKIESWEGPVFI